VRHAAITNRYKKPPSIYARVDYSAFPRWILRAKDLVAYIGMDIDGTSAGLAGRVQYFAHSAATNSFIEREISHFSKRREPMPAYAHCVANPGFDLSNGARHAMAMCRARQ
jgi:hypothetical protein